MARWIACGGNFDIGDVVRWTEGVWHQPRRGRKRKAMRVARQEVTAQVMTYHTSGWVYLQVLKCEAGESWYGLGIEPLKKSAIIKRKRTTLEKGGAEKLAGPPSSPPRRLSKFGGTLSPKQ